MLLLGSCFAIIVGSKELMRVYISYFMTIIVDVWDVCNINELTLFIMKGCSGMVIILVVFL